MGWLKAKIQGWLYKWIEPSQELLVLSLTLNAARLALGKGEFIALAPIKGCCGPFRLSGNSLPVFDYRVFDKGMMEFVAVRVEVSKPDRIEFLATIDSIKTSDPKRHGEVVSVTDKYKAPFNLLAGHLFRYFPLYREVIE